MATKKVAKKTASPAIKRAAKSAVKAQSLSRTKPRTKPQAKPASTTNVAHRVVLAGLGAAERAAEQVQGNAVKVYGMISRETERLSEMTAEAAQALGKKAGVFVKEGKKIQSNVQAAAEAKAREVAKEVKAFAAKSEKSFAKNVRGSVKSTAASAMEGITKLEHVFESRVAKTLNTFGIPSSQNVRELQARMADLQKALNQLNKRGARA